MMNILPYLALLSFLFLYETYGQFNPQCRGKRYLCDNEDRINESDMCVYVNDTKNKVHFLQTCPQSNQICQYEGVEFGENGYCVDAPEEDKTYPGEYCSVNSDCINNVCENGVCTGAAVDEPCTADYQCGVGLFCRADTGLCQAQQEFGQNCTRDEQCTNNCACNVGECVYYYSFADGLEADNPKACQSGYVQDDVCYPALKSKVKGRPCTNDDDCQAYDSEIEDYVQYGACTCGYNGGGFTYCPLAEGDPEFQDYLNKFAFIVARSYNCHTSLRFGPCRHLYSDEYEEYTIAKKYFEMYPIVTFNDDCIKRTITWDYWKHFLSGSRIGLEIVLLLVSLIFLLM